MQLLPQMLLWLLLYTLIEAQKKDQSARKKKKKPITRELEKKMKDRLLKIHNKYKDQKYLQENPEFALMFDRVKKAIHLENFELDTKIDVLSEFESYDGLRIELEKRINGTVATIDRMLKDKHIECETEFNKMRSKLIKAIEEANQVKSKKLRNSSLKCAKKTKASKPQHQ